LLPKTVPVVNKARRAAIATRFAPRHERAVPVSKYPNAARCAADIPVFYYLARRCGDRSGENHVMVAA
jgi:hypothetical protein